jgi:hypothetical protein
MRPSKDTKKNDDDDNDETYRVGDQVWAWYGGKWYEAILSVRRQPARSSSSAWNVEYFLGGSRIMPETYFGTGEEYYVGTVTGTVTYVHPDGRCHIAYHDGEVLVEQLDQNRQQQRVVAVKPWRFRSESNCSKQ